MDDSERGNQKFGFEHGKLEKFIGYLNGDVE